ncbi:MAG: peptide deformylase [bacterium]
MSTPPILIYPDPRLRQKSKEITDINIPDIQEFIPLLKQVMLEKDGAGMAAPQLGNPIRMLAVNEPEGAKIYINPVIHKYSLFQNSFEEGCFSVPDVFGLVRRPRSIKLSYLTETGEKIKETVDGLLARVLQHEVDHLDGVLFIDKAYKITTNEHLLKEMKEKVVVL